MLQTAATKAEDHLMTATDPIVIVGAARTPMGGFLGDLKDVNAPTLGARAISDLIVILAAHHKMLWRNAARRISEFAAAKF